MKAINYRGSLYIFLAVSLVMFPFQPASARGEALNGTVTIDTPNVTVAIYPSNETSIVITGFGMLQERSGLNGPLETSLRFSLGRDSGWPATISPSSTINDIQVDRPYDFTVTVTIPPGTSEGMSDRFTVRAVFEDLLDSTETSASFTIITRLVDDGKGGDGTNTTAPDTEEKGSSKYIWIVFGLGILILMGAGGFWAYRNVEVVKDPNGDRRLYLREKDTGRTFGKEPPKGT